MSKYIQIREEQINKLTTNRLLNIFRINRKFILQTLSNFGFDTSSNCSNINWAWVNDELYHHKEFNAVSFLNENIKKELDNRKNING